MSGVRTFPALPARPKGHCRWCGDAIRTLAGALNLRAGWHRNREGVDEPDCLYEYYLHTQLAEQYEFLVDRDGEHCWDCGETPLKVVRQGNAGCMIPWEIRPPLMESDRWATSDRWVNVGPSCLIEIKPALEVEHDIPLWSVAHLPPRERWRYFGPDNLHLRCTRCHAKKTRREAAERAHGNRLRKGPKAPRRKIQSRGFAPGHRPLRS